VNQLSETNWNAVFGYINQSLCTTTIPAGPFNRLDPESPESANLPTLFKAGENTSAFVSSFTGDSLTWILGAGQATATKSLRKCTADDMPPTTGKNYPVGYGDIPSRPSQAAMVGFVRDTVGPYKSVDPVQGGAVTVIYDAQGGLTSHGPATMGVFKFEVIKQYMGGDQGDEVETDISIAILATDGAIQKEINYDNPDDWDTWSEHDGSWPVSDVVSPERATVTVRVSINEHDERSTDHWVRRIKLDNATGAVVTVMDDQNNVLKTGPLTTSCVRESEDPGHGSWGVCWAPVTVTGNLGSPQLCAKVLAEYLDSGYGQTYLEPSGSSRTQEVPASYSYASYRVSSNVKEYVVGDVRVPERTVNASTSGYFALDQNGCVPANLALKGEDMRYDPNGKLEIELRFRSEFCLDTTENNCPTDTNNNELVTSGTQYQLTDSDGKIREWCVILTSDESVTSSECDVIHASQGAFNQWNSISNTNLKYAPLNIPVSPSAQDAMTRTSGVVSMVYSRAIESPDMVGAFLLDHTIYKLKTETFCAVMD
jgi:hypothetical protein